jgi:hypothetical protein
LNQLKISFTKHLPFYLVLLLCIVLRLIPLFNYQFTYDELSGLDRTQFDSFSELINGGIKIDAHPALVQVLIYYLSKVFGFKEWIIKLPFLLFGFGAIVYAYLLCLRNFTQQAGVFISIILSFSLIFVYYAPIARMYISGVFFSLGMLYYFFEIVFLENNKVKNYTLFSLFVLFCAINQHINALFAFSLYVAGIFLIKKTEYKSYFISGICIVIAYLPNIPITLNQLGLAGIGPDQGGWLSKPHWDAFFGFFKLLLGTGKTYLVVAFIITLSFGLNKTLRLDKRHWFLICIFVVNFLIVFFYSIFRAPIYQHSVMLFAGCGVLLVLCSFIHFNNRIIYYTTSILLAGTFIYKTYLHKNYYQNHVKTGFEYQFEKTKYYQQKLGTANVYPILFDADSIMKKLYEPRYSMFTGYKSQNDSACTSTLVYSRLIQQLTSKYLILASPMPIHELIAEKYFPYVIENTETPTTNYKVYSKIKSDSSNVGLQTVRKSSPLEPNGFSYPKYDGQNNILAKVESSNEFPFDAKARYHDVIQSEGQMIITEAVIKSKEPLSALQLNTSVSDPDFNKSYSYSGNKVSQFYPINDSITRFYNQLYIGTNFKEVSKSAELGTYLWNEGKEEFELLDFKIRVVNYWYLKWHYWD